tara:strand:- start:983 stop:1855 length:873 start_codon:yes stop_codon:yes gene_type:complete
MKVIIIGSDSQIGRSLKDKNNKGNDLIYFDKNKLDITNYKQVKNIILETKPEIIINCSAFTNVVQAESEKKICNNVNNLALKNLSIIANYCNSTLIHFSTDYVFGGNSNKKYIENDIKNPLSVYGKSKKEGENQIVNACNSYLILRVSWLFSKYKNNFVNFVIEKLKKNESIYAVSDLYSIPTYTVEICNFIFYLLEHKKLNLKKYNDTYHFVNSGPVVSWYDFAIFIKTEYNKINISKSKIIKTTSNDFFKNNIRPKYSALNNKKVINEFNYKIEDWQNSIITLLNKVL